VKSDLVNLLSNFIYRDYNIGVASIYRRAKILDTWCHSLYRLLDHNLANLHMPKEFIPNKESFEKLMVDVGIRCSGLKLFEASINAHYVDEENYTWFEPIFFQALPCLANLQVVQLKYFNCDDKALKQFAIHTKRLV
jgi:hypothetical protein